MNKPIHILFIGAGRMAEAIFSGILQHEKDFTITVANQKDADRLSYLKEQYQIEVTSDWSESVETFDIVLLACPPSAHEQVLATLYPLIKPNQLVITVAAGIGPSYLEKALPANTPVAWLMPNTAADVGRSMSIYALGNAITAEQTELFTKIVGAIGPAEQVSEQQVHDLTAITGSAPAFLYYFVEALEEAALSYGITKEQARKLVLEMVIGSAAMLDKHRDPAKLREQVTSPGGATAAGIATLDEHHFFELVANAVTATNNRAKEQGQS